MSNLSQSLAYIGMLLEHHPRYNGKSFTLTEIDGQLFIQSRRFNGRSTNDICSFSRSDLEDGLTAKRWNEIALAVQKRIDKRESIFKNGPKINRTKDPR